MGEMSNINFSNITDKKVRNLYEFMWGDTSRIPGGTDGIFETLAYNKEKKLIRSNRSYSFHVDKLKDEYTSSKKIIDEEKVKICQQLIKNFNIQDKKQFHDKFFDEACSGEGGEAAKITRLHSSSLCAFLFFHTVNKDNKISIKVKNKENYEFDEVYFETKNKVVKRRKPSNIDVVLVSNTSKTILYLESKFSEYYLSNGSVEVSADYLSEENCMLGKQIYENEDIIRKIGLKRTKKFENNGGKTVFKIDSNNSINGKYKSYCGGIKQMISHYIGLANFVKGSLYCRDSRNKDLNKKLKKLFDSGYSIYLGEILFNFDNEEIIKYREDYREKYKELARLLNDFSNKNSKIKIECLSDVLLYSQEEIKNYIKENNSLIFDFYFGK